MLMINHMSAGYGDSNVIKDLNLEVADGKIVCLIGRNGVGKSTTLKGIMGLIKTAAAAVNCTCAGHETQNSDSG